jgi:hypothetical protein
VTGAPVGSVAHVATGLPSTVTITRADYLERVTAVETMTPVVDLIPREPGAHLAGRGGPTFPAVSARLASITARWCRP